MKGESLALVPVSLFTRGCFFHRALSNSVRNIPINSLPYRCQLGLLILNGYGCDPKDWDEQKRCVKSTAKNAIFVNAAINKRIQELEARKSAPLSMLPGV